MQYIIHIALRLVYCRCKQLYELVVSISTLLCSHYDIVVNSFITIGHVLLAIVFLLGLDVLTASK